MKKFKNCGLLLAIAVALVVTTMTACSSENDLVETPNVEQPTAEGIKVTVTASIADDATTRSEVVESTDANGKKRTLKFTEGDKLYVYSNNNPYPVKGMLTMVENSLTPDGKSAKFTGSLQKKNVNNWKNYTNYGDEDPLDGTTATLIHKDMVENTDYSFDRNYQIVFRSNPAPDVETLMTKNLHVTGDYDISTKSFALSSDDVIFNCNFTGLAASTEYFCELQYPVNPGYSLHGGHNFTTDANGISNHAINIPYPGDDAHPWEIQIRQSSNTVGTISLGTRTLEKKVYNLSRHWTGSAFSKTIDLSTISHDLLVGSGMTLTGTLDGTTQKYKISIADGATVTLSNATINGVYTDDSHELWAGLTCEGDATIILDGTNAVQNFNRYYPGLQPGPTGTTLTIRGSGSLTATGREIGTGIGTNYDGGSCGNIRIEGGTVTANGSFTSAGIGAGRGSTCGGITITGGTVIANGGKYGAGIGSGFGENSSASQCGNIRITGGTVTATGGVNGAGIGTGEAGKCGDISISGGTVMAQGGNNGTGIGTGEAFSGTSQCGDISITNGEGFVSVTAIRGAGASMSIGTSNGENNESYKCGRITFDGNEIFNGSDGHSYSEPNNRKYGSLSFVKTTTDDGDGNTDDTNNTWTLTPAL